MFLEVLCLWSACRAGYKRVLLRRTGFLWKGRGTSQSAFLPLLTAYLLYIGKASEYSLRLYEIKIVVFTNKISDVIIVYIKYDVFNRTSKEGVRMKLIRRLFFVILMIYAAMTTGCSTLSKQAMSHRDCALDSLSDFSSDETEKGANVLCIRVCFCEI